MRNFLSFFLLVAAFLWIPACTHLNQNLPAETSALGDIAGDLLEEPQPEVDSTRAIPEAPELTDQQRIDQALLAYQRSQDFFGEGRLEDAIAALDQSYTSILTIRSDQDPDIVQQKEDLRLLISKRLLEIYASRSQKSHIGKNSAIPLVMNSYVEREIRSFQTTERSFFIDAYARSGRYRDYIVAELREAGLPAELSWLPLIESGFKDRAFSRSRALGLWQFIASTGYRFDLKRDQWVDDRMNVEKSTRAAIEYLTALHDLFGDWTSALAAYNCGERNVLRAIQVQRVNYLDNFWDLYPMLPRETSRYVPRFLATLHIVNNPQKYGFTELRPEPPVRFDAVSVNRQMKLSDIARALSMGSEELADLNPSLRQKITPAYAYSLRVPAGKGELCTASLADIPECKWTAEATARPQTSRGHAIHRVRNGETLSSIAEKYGTSVKTIARLNRIRNTSRISVGQRLKVPSRYSASSNAAGTKYAGQYVQYRVRRGDTLWSIAKKYNTTVHMIKNINSLSGNILQYGQILQVPEGS